jgi:hypothetical protein
MIRLTCPSTAPELQGRVSPAVTAGRSDGVHPLGKIGAVQVGHHVREAAHVPNQLGQDRTAPADGIQAGLAASGSRLAGLVMIHRAARLGRRLLPPPTAQHRLNHRVLRVATGGVSSLTQPTDGVWC